MTTVSDDYRVNIFDPESGVRYATFNAGTAINSIAVVR